LLLLNHCRCLITPAACCPSPQAWPRATFKLPAAVSEPGNILRAQLLVTPKADACEEFWAMNPSGPGTNNTCGGLSTGEPYREVGWRGFWGGVLWGGGRGATAAAFCSFPGVCMKLLQLTWQHVC
jgi:hypothetical protein